MKYNAWNIDLKSQLLALMVDGVNMLCWSKTKDAERGANRPKSMYAQLMQIEEDKKHQVFKTPEEFLKKWNSL